MPTYSLPAMEEEPDWKATMIDPIMRKMTVLPRLTGKTDDEPHVLIKNFEQWLQILIRNLVTLKQASNVANRRLAELVEQTMASRVDYTEKLVTIGTEIQKLKDQFDERRQSFDSLARRFEEFDLRAKENQPLSEQEKKSAKMLKAYRRTALTMCDKTAQLSIAVANEKRDAFGPAQSFTPSMTSYSATIEKAAHEVEFLRSRATKLQELLSAE